MSVSGFQDHMEVDENYNSHSKKNLNESFAVTDPIDTKIVKLIDPCMTNDESIGDVRSSSESGDVTDRDKYVMMTKTIEEHSDEFSQFLMYPPNTEWKECIFNNWIQKLQNAETEGNVDMIRQNYALFLDEYPLCYGYWKRLANLEISKGNWYKVKKLYKDALKSNDALPELWLAYLKFLTSPIAGSSAGEIRRVFEEAITKVGHDWNSSSVWRCYIDYEVSRNSSQREAGRRISSIYFRWLTVPNNELESIKFGAIQHLSTYQGSIHELLTPYDKEDFNSFFEVQNSKHDVETTKLEEEIENKRTHMTSQFAVFEDEIEKLKKSSDNDNDLPLNPNALASELKDAEMNEENVLEEGEIDEVKNLRILKQIVELERKMDVLKSEFDIEAHRLRDTHDKAKKEREQIDLRCFLCDRRMKRYEETVSEIDRIAEFERHIRRSYYHPKQFDKKQILNWKQYINSETSIYYSRIRNENRKNIFGALTQISRDNIVDIDLDEDIQKSDGKGIESTKSNLTTGHIVCDETSDMVNEPAEQTSVNNNNNHHVNNNEVSQLRENMISHPPPRNDKSTKSVSLERSPFDILNGLYRRCLICLSDYLDFWFHYFDWLEIELPENEFIQILESNIMGGCLKHRWEPYVYFCEYLENQHRFDEARTVIEAAQKIFKKTVVYLDIALLGLEFRITKMTWSQEESAAKDLNTDHCVNCETDLEDEIQRIFTEPNDGQLRGNNSTNSCGNRAWIKTYLESQKCYMSTTADHLKLTSLFVKYLLNVGDIEKARTLLKKLQIIQSECVDYFLLNLQSIHLFSVNSGEFPTPQISKEICEGFEEVLKDDFKSSDQFKCDIWRRYVEYAEQDGNTNISMLRSIKKRARYFFWNCKGKTKCQMSI